MKEYKIQMMFDGKWGVAWHATGSPSFAVYQTAEAARNIMRSLKAEWENGTKCKKEPPTGYRIVSRTVTEWEPEEE